MSRLPHISGAEALRRFERAGWKAARQRRSHVVMTGPGVTATLSVPQRAELDGGLLRALIRSAGLSVDALEKL